MPRLGSETEPSNQRGVKADVAGDGPWAGLLPGGMFSRTRWFIEHDKHASPFAGPLLETTQIVRATPPTDRRRKDEIEPIDRRADCRQPVGPGRFNHHGPFKGNAVERSRLQTERGNTDHRDPRPGLDRFGEQHEGQ